MNIRGQYRLADGPNGRIIFHFVNASAPWPTEAVHFSGLEKGNIPFSLTMLTISKTHIVIPINETAQFKMPVANRIER